MSIVEANDLRKVFSTRRRSRHGILRRLTGEPVRTVAVDRVSLRLEAGSIVGYIGPNGAGKSTTIKMLTGILVPTEGFVRVCGLEPVRQRKQLARRIGVVFGQRTQLWWDLPVRRYGSRPMDDLVDPTRWDAHVLGKPVLTDPHGE